MLEICHLGRYWNSRKLVEIFALNRVGIRRRTLDESFGANDRIEVINPSHGIFDGVALDKFRAFRGLCDGQVASGEVNST